MTSATDCEHGAPSCVEMWGDDVRVEWCLKCLARYDLELALEEERDRIQRGEYGGLSSDAAVCAPLCGASKAYGRFDAPWKHELQCPVRQEWDRWRRHV